MPLYICWDAGLGEDRDADGLFYDARNERDAARMFVEQTADFEHVPDCVAVALADPDDLPTPETLYDVACVMEPTYELTKRDAPDREHSASTTQIPSEMIPSGITE